MLSPNRDFVTNFYLENTQEETEREPDPDFYRRLDEAIEAEQLEDGLEWLKKMIDELRETPEKKAA